MHTTSVVNNGRYSQINLFSLIIVYLTNSFHLIGIRPKKSIGNLKFWYIHDTSYNYFSVYK